MQQGWHSPDPYYTNPPLQGLVYRVRCLIAHAGQDVAVGISGDRDGDVPE